MKIEELLRDIKDLPTTVDDPDPVKYFPVDVLLWYNNIWWDGLLYPRARKIHITGLNQRHIDYSEAKKKYTHFILKDELPKGKEFK